MNSFSILNNVSTRREGGVHVSLDRLLGLPGRERVTEGFLVVILQCEFN